MFWSTIWLGSTILICIICAEKLDNFQRYKRFVNVSGMSVVDKNQHSKEYPFIVGVKTFHTRYGEIMTTRCTGTMLNPRLLLTTSYCVQNPLQITVFKNRNPESDDLNAEGVDIDVKNISEVNDLITSGQRHQFPNPLFYGTMINHNHMWYMQYPLEEKYSNSPLRNLAIVSLKDPLYTTNINFPVIGRHPGYFTGKSVSANMFGWCQVENKSDPLLTMAKVDVSSCEIKRLIMSNVCVDTDKYEDAFCELDQGGPVLVKGPPDSKMDKGQIAGKMMLRVAGTSERDVWGGRDVDEETLEPPPTSGRQKFVSGPPEMVTLPMVQHKWSRPQKMSTTHRTPVSRQRSSRPPRHVSMAAQKSVPNSTEPSKGPAASGDPQVLIAVVNTDKSYGYLTYLWMYDDWIESVLEEFAAVPTTPVPCDVESTSGTDAEPTTVNVKQVHVESFYDYDSRFRVRNAHVPCNRASAVRQPSYLNVLSVGACLLLAILFRDGTATVILLARGYC